RLRRGGGVPVPVGEHLPRPRLGRVRRDDRLPHRPRRDARVRLQERSARVGEVTLSRGGEGFFTTRFDALLDWARRYSLFQYPFSTACCAMEFFGANSPR